MIRHRTALAALCLALIAADANTARIPYRTLAGPLHEVQALPAASRTLLRPSLRLVKRDGSPVPGLAATLETPGRTAPVPISPDGTLALPDDAATWDANPLLITNQPRGTLNAVLALTIALPPTGTAPTAYWRQALAQADAAVAEGARARLGLLARLQRPHVNGLILRFAGAGTATPPNHAAIPSGPDGTAWIAADLLAANGDLVIQGKLRAAEPRAE